VVCWAAHMGWLNLSDSRLALMGSSVATYAFSAFAIGEIVADKLPSKGNVILSGVRCFARETSQVVEGPL
jgi:uncharacterized membrane protein